MDAHDCDAGEDLLRALRRALSFYCWTPRRIEWVAPGDYALGIVNRVPGRPGTRPVFEHDSNVIRVRILR